MDNAAKDYAAGMAAGVATVAVGHPFDTVKVKLQACNEAAGRRPSAFQCAQWILKQDGVKGLYRGAASSFLGMAVESSLFFGVYAQMKSWLQGGEHGSAPKLSAVVPSAAVAGAMISVILCPTELFKCRLQVQEKALGNLYSGPVDCARKTLAIAGVRGLFRGWSATFARECAGNMCFFTTYEISRHYMRSRLLPKDEPWPVVEALVAIASGGISGMAFWVAVLPIDAAKTRIQTAVDLRETTNLAVQVKLVYREFGFRGLYAGLGPTLLRAFPANAAAIVTWELTAKLLGRSTKVDTLEGSLL